MFALDVKVYIACRMSGRDKLEMVTRAKRVCEIFREVGIIPISPVIEEKVDNTAGKLINTDKVRLHGYWKRDKEIIIKEAHVVFLDHAEMKSLGMEREYCLNRGVLWKPTVIYLPKGSIVSVAEWEDDAVLTSVHDVANLIVANWGTRYKRWIWRLKMLNRSLPTWIYRQIIAWR